MIKKICIWINPSPFGSGKARWDMDLHHDDGRIERKTGITPKEAKEIIGEVMADGN